MADPRYDRMKWTPDKCELLMRLLDQGVAKADIATRFGLSASAIRTQYRKQLSLRARAGREAAEASPAN